MVNAIAPLRRFPQPTFNLNPHIPAWCRSSSRPGFEVAEDVFVAFMLSLADFGRSVHRPPFPNPEDHPRILHLGSCALGMSIINTERISRRMVRCCVSAARYLQVHLARGHSQSPIPGCQVSSLRLPSPIPESPFFVNLRVFDLTVLSRVRIL